MPSRHLPKEPEQGLSVIHRPSYLFPIRNYKPQLKNKTEKNRK